VLRRDFGKALGARVRALTHKIICELEDVNLHVHYPSFRDGECTLQDLVDVISLYLAPFALPRVEVEEVQQEYGKISADEYDALHADLHTRAIELFKKAQVATNRNGEAGELLLCLLTEWILDAPQLLAKMSLKTSTEMAVHGSDGVHVKFCTETKRLILFWGEAKFYGRISEAMVSASDSIAKALDPKKVRHEISLVKRYLSFTGLDPEAAKAFKAHLNPFKDDSNQRVNVTTCLIGFDFTAYSPTPAVPRAEMEAAFLTELNMQLPGWASTVSALFKQHGIENQRMELFFFPLPSVAEFRNMFQSKIGWKPATEPQES
jgi:hypothetical protein